jgi:hypothetical protein
MSRNKHPAPSTEKRAPSTQEQFFDQNSTLRLTFAPLFYKEDKSVNLLTFSKKETPDMSINYTYLDLWL